MKFFLLLLFLPLLLVASTQKVSVQFEWKHQFEFAGFYAAIEKGYYKDVGLDVELKEFHNGINVIGSVLDGNSTFGISSSALILNKLQGKPVVLLASYFKQNALALVTKPDIKKISDLKNKTIMAMPHEIDYTSIGVMLHDNKLKKSDYTLINQNYNIDKFINGEVDAMSVFISNQLFLLNKKNIKYNILNPSDYGIYSYDEELFTSSDFALKYPTKVSQFIEATKKGWKYTFKNKEEIVELIYTKYTQEKSKDALLYEANQIEKLFKLDVFTIGSIVPALIEVNTVLYKKLNLVNEQIDMKNLLATYLFKNKEQKFDFLTKEETKFMNNHPLFRVHMENNYIPYSDIGNNNKFIGYSIDYANMLANRLGVKFTYNKNENWSEAISNLKNKKIDIIAQMINTNERQKFALFNDKYMTYYQAIVVKKNNSHFNSLLSLKNKKVGVVKGYTIAKILQKYYPNIKIFTYKTNEELLKSVHLETIDAGITNHQVAQYKINTLLFNDLLSIPILHNKNITKTDETFGVRKDFPLLHSALQKAFKSITTQEIASLELKWFGKKKSISNTQKRINLTDKELNYLKNNKIKMCIDPAWMPFEQLKNSKHIGISADFFKIIEKRLKTTIELIPTSAWSESIEFAKNRKCDILSLAMETPSRKEYMNFTSPYLKIPLVLATKPKVAFISDFYVLKNKKIGIPKGYAFSEILRKRYPNIDIIDVKNVYDGLLQVKNGELFGYIGTLASVGYMFQTEYTGELKIAGKFDEIWELGIAVRNDNIVLFNILQKAVKSISTKTQKQIINEWVNIKYEKNVNYSIIWKILFLTFLIIVVSIYSMRKLTLLNKKLTKAKLKAEEATALKAHFLANMSHEIRTPMNSIVGMSYLLKETDLNTIQHSYCLKIEKSSHNLLKIIDDILDFSKLEAGKLTLSKSSFNLSTLLNDLEDMFLIKTDEKNLIFKIIYDKSINMHLYGDNLKISRILINLLSNAIKFTENGSVELNIIKLNNSQFRFEVTDTGIGLTPAQMKNIFSSFIQADSSITRKYGGTGLGLSISSELVSLMSGKIWVESTLGKGSNFIFEIELESRSNYISNKENQKELLKNSNEKSKPYNEKEIKELFSKLHIATTKRRPQLCEPILKELSLYTLDNQQNELFNRVDKLIKKYKFDEAKRLLDAK